MEVNNKSELMERFLPFLKKPSKSWYILLAILGIFGAIGMYSFIQQIVHGHGITGMRDNVVWGVYIVNFIYFLGLSYAGAMISGVFHLARIKWGKPLIRIIEIMSFICLLIGPVYILLCIGRLDRLHYLFIYPRLQSPITWDLIAVMTDLVFCAVYLYMTFIKDFAGLNQLAEKEGIANWKRKLYKALSFGYKGTKKQKFHLNRAQDIMAAILIPTAIIAYSLLAWLFGMNLKVGWNSSIFAPYFVLTAVFSGIALIIILLWISRNIYKIKDVFTDKYFYIFGYALLILSLVFGYFTFSDYITNWYNSNLTTEKLMDVLFSGKFGFMYVLTMILACGLPILFIAFPWFRKPKTIVFTAFMVLIALYLNRYLIIVPVLETPYLDILSTDKAFYDYNPNWIEWSLTIAGVTFSLMIFMVLSKIIPIIPVSEIEEEKQEFKLFGKVVFK